MKVNPGDASRSRCHYSEVAVIVYVRLVGAHGLADPGQDHSQRCDVLIDEDEDVRFVSFDSPEFHLWLVVASGVEPNRDVLGPVLVDEEDPPQQDPLGIGECRRKKSLRGKKSQMSNSSSFCGFGCCCCSLRLRTAIAEE